MCHASVSALGQEARGAQCRPKARGYHVLPLWSQPMSHGSGCCNNVWTIRPKVLKWYTLRSWVMTISQTLMFSPGEVVGWQKAGCLQLRSEPSLPTNWKATLFFSGANFSSLFNSINQLAWHTYQIRLLFFLISEKRNGSEKCFHGPRVFERMEVAPEQWGNFHKHIKHVEVVSERAVENNSFYKEYFHCEIHSFLC